MTTPLNYEPVSLDRQEAYLRYFQKCPQKTSDYSFVNLWAWTEAYGLSWAWDNDLVWIKQTLPQTVYWAPVGPWEQVDWKSRLSPFIEGQAIFIRIPENLVLFWKACLENQIQIIEARGHWDYLYSIEELIQLKGNRFHKKKNLLNQFKRTTITHTRRLRRKLSLTHQQCKKTGALGGIVNLRIHFRLKILP